MAYGAMPVLFGSPAIADHVAVEDQPNFLKGTNVLFAYTGSMIL